MYLINSMDFSSFTSILFGSRSSSSSPTTVAEPEAGLKYLTAVPLPHQNPSCMIRRVDLFWISPASISPCTKKDKKEESEVEEKEEAEECKRISIGNRNQQRRSSSGGLLRRREFPPPIHYLARTENLPGYMPWVFKRSYKEGGRLVIKEVKNKHHEYFKAHRANGRLTLKLMHMDTDQLLLRRNTSNVDADDDDDDASEDEQEEEGRLEEKQESQLSSGHCHDDDLILEGKSHEDDDEKGFLEEEEEEDERVVAVGKKQYQKKRETFILAKGRVGCLQNNKKSTQLGIQIPTVRPILIGRID